MPNILIVGSLAFDIIFEVHGNIKNEIPLRDGFIDNINLMFTAKNKREYFGGTAGNIAYGLGLLKEHPLLFSLVGKDFDNGYRDHLSNNNIIQKVIQKDDEFTATFYGISDENKQQIGIWQPNAYGNWIDKALLLETISEKELNLIKVAIFSPGTGKSTYRMLKEFRQFNKNAKVIFDPSQVLSIFFDTDLVRKCLKLSNYFIGNDIEVAQLKALFNLEIKDLLDLGIEAVIETKGEKGLSIHYQNEFKSKITIDIPPIKPVHVQETTGAGDAFRSGFIYGLSHNKNIIDSCKIGAYMGSKCVEEFSGQLYKINIEEIKNLI